MFDENAAWNAKDILSKMIEMHNLHEFAQSKGYDYDKLDGYADNVFELTRVKADEMKLKKEFIDMNKRVEEWELSMNYAENCKRKTI